MFSKILRGAVLATFAVGATAAQADPFSSPNVSPMGGTFVWNGKAISNGYLADQGIKVSVPNVGGTAGLFTGQFNPNTESGGLDSGDVFTFFCIDLYEYVSPQGTPDSSYTRWAEIVPAGTTSDSQRLRNLFLGNNWPTEAKASAAMQLAIWNIIYDTDAVVDGGSGFMATGNASQAANETITLANDMMLAAMTTAVRPTGDDANVFRLFTFISSDSSPLSASGDGKQDFIAFTYRPRSEGDNGVPLPGTLALLGIGLAGLGLARRKS